MPFLQNLSDQAIEAMSQAFATVGVLAGLPPDVTDTLLSRPCSSNADFIQQCMHFALVVVISLDLDTLIRLHLSDLPCPSNTITTVVMVQYFL